MARNCPSLFWVIFRHFLRVLKKITYNISQDILDEIRNQDLSNRKHSAISSTTLGVSC
jgi:hypothetical protein